MGLLTILFISRLSVEASLTNIAAQRVAKDKKIPNEQIPNKKTPNPLNVQEEFFFSQISSDYFWSNQIRLYLEWNFNLLQDDEMARNYWLYDTL